MNEVVAGALGDSSPRDSAARRRGAAVDRYEGRRRGNDGMGEVLRAVAVKDALFFAHEPVPVRSSPSFLARPSAPRLPAGEGYVIECHVILTGSCRASVAGEPPTALEAGDVLLLLHGGARSTWQPGVTLTSNAGSPPTEIIGALLGCDARALDPLLHMLPRVVHSTRAADDRPEQLARLALHESMSRCAGAACALSRLGELLLIEVVRRHWAVSPPEDGVWLGVRHDDVGRVLAKLHDRPAHDWSLQELARAGGMSRSVLAERFAQVVGVPPMQYLSQRRMQLAARLLASTSLSLAEIAQRVGYGSETSLSRAYKRSVGVAPSEWRRKRRALGHERGPQLRAQI
jgi:AraC-like DNA-binding protein